MPKKVSANECVVSPDQVAPDAYEAARALTLRANTMSEGVNKCTGSGDNGLGGIYVKNIAENLKTMEGNMPSLRNCRGAFGEQDTVFLVGAGPSLEKNYLKLARVAHAFNASIVAVDLAAEWLATHGIIPDFVVTIESMKWEGYFTKTSKPLQKLCGDSALLTISGVEPDYLRDFPGRYRDAEGKTKRKAFFVHGDVHDDDPKADWYKRQNDLVPINMRMACGSNVASMALMMVYYMGARRVVFVGHDYGFYDPQKTHAGVCSPYRSTIIPWLFDKDGTEVFSFTGLLLPKYFTEVMVLNMAMGMPIGKVALDEGGAKVSGKAYSLLQHKFEFWNATEGGIFGLEETGKPLPWFKDKIITLDEATRRWAVPNWNRLPPEQVISGKPPVEMAPEEKQKVEALIR